MASALVNSFIHSFEKSPSHVFKKPYQSTPISNGEIYHRESSTLFKPGASLRDKEHDTSRRVKGQAGI